MTPEPTIAVVTPSYNQAEFLPQAIESVLGQDYPHLEYAIVDGGSSDGSVEIIRQHESRLAFWRSEPDGGIYEAIDVGFKRTSGEIMGWINSDDKYLPWTFATVAEIFASFPEIEWLTSLRPLTWDRAGRAVETRCIRGYNRESFLRGEQVPLGGWYSTYAICQECTFWRRSLWERAGAGLDTSLKCAGDLELWARFFEHAELYGAEVPLAGARRGNEWQMGVRSGELCSAETMQLFERYGIRPRGRWTESLYPRLVLHAPGGLLRLMGLAKPTKVCVHRDGTWAIETGQTGIVRSST